jgi:hypothetical protein
MAVIFSYPPINSGNLQPEDRLILSQMSEPTNPTKTVTLSNLASYINGSGSGFIVGTGLAQQMTYWSGPNTIKYDAVTPFTYIEAGGGGLVAGRMGIGSASPDFKLDIGGGDLRIEDNFGIRFGGQSSNATNWKILTTGTNSGTWIVGNSVGTPKLTIFKSGLGDPTIEGKVQFNDYGSGNFTGLAAQSLAVTATGEIIEIATGTAIPWPYQYDAALQTFIQGANPASTGTENTGYGFGALDAVSTGSNNVALGDSAAKSLTTGSGNIIIGNDAEVSNINGQNQIVIGSGTTSHGDNTASIGNASTISFEAFQTNTTDLGTSTYTWKDYYGEGNINLGNINSRIGVGLAYAANTRGAVEVDAFVNFNGAPFNYFIPNGVLPTGYPIGVFDYYTGTDLFAISYWGVGRFMGSGIHIFSDERSKVIHGISKSKEDLDILNNIEITEFNYIDPVKGNGKQKKVIAQQVEKVYPRAVSTGHDVIPNIFKESEINSGVIKLENTCEVGDKIQLVYEDSSKEIVEVIACHETKIVTDSKKKGKVFVYGNEIDDYKSVDYDAISMLNVSATQELHKIIKKLSKKIEDLTNKVNSLENK